MLPPIGPSPTNVLDVLLDETPRIAPNSAAMVATVADKGYEATTVADLVKLSGVSRSAFYRHFEDKQECFLTAAEITRCQAGTIVEDWFFQGSEVCK